MRWRGGGGALKSRVTGTRASSEQAGYGASLPLNSVSMSSETKTKASLAAKIISLNEQFAQWIQSQDKTSLWLDGVEDYRAYAEEICKDLKQLDAHAVEASAAAAATAERTEPKLFSFNPSSTAPVAPSAGFGGFSAPPVAFNKPAEAVVLNGDGETERNGEDKDSEQPLIDETNAADVLFSKKVHLLSQDPETKKWKDKGTGTFSLRKSKDGGDGKRVSYIVFTAATGKVLINAPVIKGMKPMVNEKAPSNVIMLLFGMDDAGAQSRQMHLFKCGSMETANELRAAVSAEAE